MRLSTIGYCFRQGLKNVFRNLKFSLASIVTIAACILTEVEPAGVSAGGDRVHDYTLTFRPSGGAVTVPTGNQ